MSHDVWVVGALVALCGLGIYCCWRVFEKADNLLERIMFTLLASSGFWLVGLLVYLSWP